uniref:Uncharacterized protein n=1 Tax=Caenorhabditis tropicalis TaxID=1561998 RepID=A0A1I7UV53_9PELO
MAANNNMEMKVDQKIEKVNTSKDTTAIFHDMYSDCELPGTSTYSAEAARAAYLAGPTFRTPEFLRLCLEFGVEGGEISPPMTFEDTTAGLNAASAFFGEEMEDLMIINDAEVIDDYIQQEEEQEEEEFYDDVQQEDMDYEEEEFAQLYQQEGDEE